MIHAKDFGALYRSFATEAFCGFGARPQAYFPEAEAGDDGVVGVEFENSVFMGDMMTEIERER